MMTVLQFSDINVVFKYADHGDFYFPSLWKLGHSYCGTTVRVYLYIYIYIFPQERSDLEMMDIQA